MNTWKLIDSFFTSNTNSRYISNHHLDSFNIFMKTKIPYIIQTLNPFVIIKDGYEINVYVGGVEGTGIYVSKPYNEDGNILFPIHARLEDVTYSSEIYVDVLIEYRSTKDANASVITSNLKKVPIGNIPIMVQSDLCNLQGMDRNELIQSGECPYDQGGYFIVDGKEKTIVSQERVATNKLFLSSATDTSIDKYIKMGLIRCTSKKNSLFPKTITLLTLASTERKNAITIEIPNIFSSIPLYTLFRALGYVSDKEITEIIFANNIENVSQHYLSFIRKSIHDSSHSYTQADALDYIARYTKYKDPKQVLHILKNDLFPNVGPLFKNKAMYTGTLVFKLIRHALGELTDTNRDSYLVKRVDVSGILMTNMFRDGYNQLRNNIKNKIDKEFIYGSWADMNEFKTIIEGNVKSIFDRNFITEISRRSFKGKWGLKESEGIVQDLNRLSYTGYISHTRRVNTPMDRSLKLVTPHRADASQWGFMCPIESPDGENIGLLKHMATSCFITQESDEDEMVQCLHDLGMKPIDELYALDIQNHTKVLLNNNFVGTHDSPMDLLQELRRYKRNNIINYTTSISWDIIENEIEIFNDAGRCVRPIIINTPESLKRFKSILLDKSISDKWSNMVPSRIGNLGYDKDRVKNNVKGDIPCLEFIDSTETSRALIAMKYEDIDLNPMNKYDYIEIHPSLILSLYSCLIPLAHHNQAPRNIFSGQQGKQAVGVYASNFNKRIDTAGYLLHYPQQGLLNTKYSKYTNTDALTNGENVIVAIATYTGYNQEDSLIINKNSIERGLFNSSIYKAYVDSEDENPKTGEYLQFGNPLNMVKAGAEINIKYAKWDKIDEHGFPLENKYIEEDDVFVGKVKTTVVSNKFDETAERIRTDEQDNMIKTYSDKSEVATFTNGGMIDKVYVYSKNDKTKLKIRFRKTREPVLGDKFASRHGQKGVIGMILPQEDMPFTKDGVVPDLIVNPHAFPSRMTIGHLIEAVLTRYACETANRIDGTVFEHLDLESYTKLLEKRGVHKHSDEIMYNGFTGEQMQTQIFFGPTYYFRLKHMVNDKMNYREGVDPAKAPITGTTKQPTHGRANQGGLRIGEMETNALLGHGIASFIKESMMERSDKDKFVMDKEGGDFANPHKDAPLSLIDDHYKSFTNVEMPYTFKLLSQEMKSMGIKPIFHFNRKNEPDDDVVEEDIDPEFTFED